MERTSVGSWSWRDGLICVTDQGFGVGPFNTWHAGIIAPQKNYSVAEAANSNSPVRLRKGKWTQGTVWQGRSKDNNLFNKIGNGRSLGR